MTDNKLILRKCSCCKSEKLLKYFKVNVKGEYNKTCLQCSERRKIQNKYIITIDKDDNNNNDGSENKITITNINKSFKNHDCKCISTTYINSLTPLLWECSAGHQWEKVLSASQIHPGCMTCKSSKYKEDKYKEIKEYAINKGGECLSSEFIDMRTKIKFKCKREHIWEAIVNMDCWCRICFEIDQKCSIEQANEYAAKKLGKCLSTEYKSARDKLLWECYNKHTWEANFDSIKNQYTWCPHCNINISEEITRCIFEMLFNKKFIKVRPDWLNKLELDGYCEELKLAFEYDGEQHYKFIERFHKSEENFKKQLENDSLKDKLCKENNIILIRIPYSLKYDEIKAYICDECMKLSIVVSNNVEIDHTKFTQIYKYNDERYNDIKRIVEAKEGTLLSTHYISASDKVEVKCGKNHIWKVTPNHLKSNRWCPKCPKVTSKYTIVDLQRLANEKEGKYLSTEYINNHTKYLWECKNGHQWYATAHHIRDSGSWCPHNLCRLNKKY
ncbi:hypothetical protein Klosneuvirus_5_30 [Klosneuvirus KNV1]|uniref:Zinc-ribbon domain-containing protein n=1 Tax=Klosneuvirus KNV1 TaxID=1977640 RepID=A0A1V0SKV6_9VIRU|nr:hypothetical protein Klosneuvirus_5_30 [Klosneuvirus KNV1]